MMFKDKPKKRPWRNAVDTTDEPYHQQVPLLKVTDEGVPADEVMIDLETRDIQAQWQQKEPILWLTIAICSVYFLFILLTYGA